MIVYKFHLFYIDNKQFQNDVSYWAKIGVKVKSIFLIFKEAFLAKFMFL